MYGTSATRYFPWLFPRVGSVRVLYTLASLSALRFRLVTYVLSTDSDYPDAPRACH